MILYSHVYTTCTEWRKLDLTWRLWHDNCEQKIYMYLAANTELCCVTSQNRKIQRDLWILFSWNATQQSLVTLDLDAYNGWCISNIEPLKKSLKWKKNPFRKSIMLCLWMIWCLSRIDQGNSDTSDVEIVCHEVWKNCYSVSVLHLLRTIVRSFCMKSLILVFVPDALLISHCSWDMMKLTRLIWYENPKHCNKRGLTAY